VQQSAAACSRVQQKAERLKRSAAERSKIKAECKKRARKRKRERITEVKDEDGQQMLKKKKKINYETIDTKQKLTTITSIGKCSAKSNARISHVEINPH
jgi:hypothetical protein